MACVRADRPWPGRHLARRHHRHHHDDTAAGARRAVAPGRRPLLRDRWWFAIVFLVALILLASTDAGRIFYDTKLGVDIDAGHFLTRLWSLWNSREWLGRLEDQYIGYAIPMVPFYLAGQLLHVPVWMIERVWLALLLAAGFIGLVKLARAVGSAARPPGCWPGSPSPCGRPSRS